MKEVQKLPETVISLITEPWKLRNCPQSTGWLKALADPQIGQALSLIHANPESPWTVASLAAAVSIVNLNLFGLKLRGRKEVSLAF